MTHQSVPSASGTPKNVTPLTADIPRVQITINTLPGRFQGKKGLRDALMTRRIMERHRLVPVAISGRWKKPELLECNFNIWRQTNQSKQPSRLSFAHVIMIPPSDRPADG